MDEWSASVTVDEATMSKLFDIFENIDIRNTPSFTITDKYGTKAIYQRLVILEGNGNEKNRRTGKA